MKRSLLFLVISTFSFFCLFAQQPNIREIEQQTEAGNATMKYQLAQGYFMGCGIPHDTNKGMKWLRKAAEQGLPAAQRDLGNAYATGKFLSKNETEAVKWLRKAAEGNNIDAQNTLANCYTDGQLGFSKDPVEAFKWYEKAANLGDHHSAYYTACRYENGIGVTQDYVEAYKWFIISCRDDLRGYFDGKDSDKWIQEEESLKQKMTIKQINEGQKLANDWINNFKRDDRNLD